MGAVGVVVVWGGGCCVCFGWQGAVCVDVFGLLWHGVGLAMGGLCGVGFRGLGFRGLGLRVLGFGCRVKGLGISSISEGCRSRCCSWMVLQLFCFLQWLMMTLTSRYCNLVHADGGGFGNEMGCLCQHERPHIHSFLRVQRCDRAGLFASLTWKCRRKTVPFRVKRGKAALMFRVSSTLRTSTCQQWLLHHPRGGNILVESVGQTVVTLRFRWRMNREVKVIMSRMSGRRWASVKATTSMRVCALRRNLEEKMDGLIRIDQTREGKGSVYYRSWPFAVSERLCHSLKSFEEI